MLHPVRVLERAAERLKTMGLLGTRPRHARRREAAVMTLQATQPVSDEGETAVGVTTE